MSLKYHRMAHCWIYLSEDHVSVVDSGEKMAKVGEKMIKGPRERLVSGRNESCCRPARRG